MTLGVAFAFGLLVGLGVLSVGSIWLDRKRGVVISLSFDSAGMDKLKWIQGQTGDDLKAVFQKSLATYEFVVWKHVQGGEFYVDGYRVDFELERGPRLRVIKGNDDS